MTQPEKRKVAILGGGAGTLAAAFELSSLPGWQDRFEITVYRLGWRLGGKGLAVGIAVTLTDDLLRGFPLNRQPRVPKWLCQSFRVPHVVRQESSWRP